MAQVKTELWSHIVGKLVECKTDATDADVENEINGLSDYLAVYALELGADIHTVDVRSAIQPLDVFVLLAKRLGFPDYFGQNLDALYDVVGEYVCDFQAKLDSRENNFVPQVWLIHSTVSQEKMLFPILDTLRDAMSNATGVGLSIIWVVKSD